METEKITPLEQPTPISEQWKSFLLATAILAACLSLPLYHLVRFAAGNELFSYILLIPFITGYLVYSKKGETRANSKPRRGTGVLLAIVGAAVLAGHLIISRSGYNLEPVADLALVGLAMFLFVLAAAFLFLGKETVRAYAFPFAMLVFIVPLPLFILDYIEFFLQYGSAYTADGMFWLSRMPFVQDDLILRLPGIALRVAPECSGIHSSLILFITSLLAGYLFLRSPWKRTILTLAVIPLALLRNGFRIFTIGQLCVHYGPQMIESPIHRKGGPLFFALSLAPFFLLLVFLHRSERRKKESKSVTS